MRDKLQRDNFRRDKLQCRGTISGETNYSTEDNFRRGKLKYKGTISGERNYGTEGQFPERQIIVQRDNFRRDKRQGNNFRRDKLQCIERQFPEREFQRDNFRRSDEMNFLTNTLFIIAKMLKTFLQHIFFSNLVSILFSLC